ncbi:MAG TPA: hypothetical protein H9684_02440 [Firmicutes bacterium]|nr:hypothetical protein [Bacillota bacterium]
MVYENLRDLLLNSSSARRYFLSLPVSRQMELHRYGGTIRSAAQLRRLADSLDKYRHQLELGGFPP